MIYWCTLAGKGHKFNQHYRGLQLQSQTLFIASLQMQLSEVKTMKRDRTMMTLQLRRVDMWHCGV